MGKNCFPMLFCSNSQQSKVRTLLRILLYQSLLLCFLLSSRGQLIEAIQLPPSVHPDWGYRTSLLAEGEMLDPLLFWESEYWFQRSQLFSTAHLWWDSLSPNTGRVILKAHPRPTFSFSPTIWLSPFSSAIGVELQAISISNPALLAAYRIEIRNLRGSPVIRHTSRLQFQGLSPLYLLGSLTGIYADSTRFFSLLIRRPVERSDIALGTRLVLYAIDDYYPLNQQRLRRSRIRLFNAFHFDVGSTLPLYFTAAIAVQKTLSSHHPLLRTFLDNTLSLLVGLTSLRQEYDTFRFLPDFTPVIPAGASGTVFFGKTFALDSTASSVVYLAGRAEQGAWLFHRSLYLYGAVSGGSGFANGNAVFTMQESEGRLHWQIDSSWFVRFYYHQRTHWNWRAFTQLFAGERFGVRGYADVNRTGENRFIATAELHYMLPQPWLPSISAVLFADVGATWNQGDLFLHQPFFPAVGIGLHCQYRLFSLPRFLRLEGGVAIRSRQWFIQLSTQLPLPQFANIQPPSIFFLGTDQDVEPIP